MSATNIMPEKIVSRDVQDAWEWLNAQAERLDIGAEEIGIAMSVRHWLIYQIEALAPYEVGRLKDAAPLPGREYYAKLRRERGDD